MKIGTTIRLLAADAAFALLPVSRPQMRRRAAVLMLDAIGDFVLWVDFGIALIRHLKSQGYEVSLVASPFYRELATALDIADEMIVIDTGRLCSDAAYRLATFRDLARRGFEIAISPTFWRHYLIVDSLVRATRAPVRIGSEGGLASISAWQKRISNRWYTRLVAASSGILHELERNAEFLAGLEVPAPQAPSALRGLADRLATATGEVETNGTGFYLVAPGAGWALRRWPPAQFASVVDRLHQATGWTGLICGAARDRPLAKEIMEHCKAPLEDRTGATSLTELVGLCAKARLLLGNDSGLVHLAAAIGLPTIAILGGGDFGRFMPYPQDPGQGQLPPRAVFHRMDCYNCHWSCRYEVPDGSATPCITNVTPEAVWAEVQDVLRGAAGGPAEST